MSIGAPDDLLRWYGLYPALVEDLLDPLQLGRVQVRFPGFGSIGDEVRCWATLLSPYADDNQGLRILPEVGSQVVVGFEAGDPARGYIVGACWNGRAALPEAPESANNLRLLRTRAGSELRFDDTAGAPVVTLSTQAGHQLKLDEASSEVELKHSNGCVIRIDAAGKVTVEAHSAVDVSAAVINLKAPMVKSDGVLKCETLITQAEVSPSYTPGAGNVW
jgi:uncharacterized protein involved in type VI secretion and phage assembly